MKERCWILVGDYRKGVWRVQRRRPAAGEPATVAFDWRWALAREERCGDVVGFWHTHPPGAGTAPSARDVRTLQAWCSALGKPLLCVIGGSEDPAAYVFADDESAGIPIGVPRRVAHGRWHVARQA